jgi:hypothetical protein
MTTQLSPPWYTLWNEIKASIGNDPGVTVGDLDTSQTPYIVPISVDNHDKAVAIASIMNLHHQMGNITVDVQVKDPAGNIVTPITPSNPQALVELIESGLGNNGWFQKVVAQPFYPGSPSTVVFVVFSKAVIQFFNDDLSDLYNNYNNVVAFVFRDVLHPAPGGISLYSSTAEE